MSSQALLLPSSYRFAFLAAAFAAAVFAFLGETLAAAVFAVLGDAFAAASAWIPAPAGISKLLIRQYFIILFCFTFLNHILMLLPLQGALLIAD
jgi:hypothetical protein